MLEDNSDKMEEFRTKKQHYNTVRQHAAIVRQFKDGCVETGETVLKNYSDLTEDTVMAFDFYDWASYMANSQLGNQTNTVKAGHVECVYKNVRGVAIFNIPPGCTRVKVMKMSENLRSTCTASTINGRERFPGEISKAKLAGVLVGNLTWNSLSW